MFNIPDLLEAILVSLNASRLLDAQRVNRQFHTVIEHSRRSQRKLSLERDPNEHIHFPLGNLRALGARFFLAEDLDGSMEKRKFTAIFHLPLPKTGSTCQKIVVRQCPIRKMDITVYCCRDHRVMHVPSWVDGQESGLTIRDL